MTNLSMSLRRPRQYSQNRMLRNLSVFVALVGVVVAVIGATGATFGSKDTGREIEQPFHRSNVIIVAGLATGAVGTIGFLFLSFFGRRLR